MKYGLPMNNELSNRTLQPLTNLDTESVVDLFVDEVEQAVGWGGGSTEVNIVMSHS